MTLPTHFQQRRDGTAILRLTVDSLLVGGLGVLAYHLHNPIGYVVAFILVGARGQALYILQHEAMHGLLFSGRSVNDKVGIVLSAFLGTQFYFGRAVHMKHHRDIGTASDPNEYFHRTEDKKPKIQFVRFLLFQLLGGRLLIVVAGLVRAVLTIGGLRALAARVPYISSAENVGLLPKYRRCDLAALAVVQAIMFASIMFTSQWYVYVLFYVLPLSTLTAFFEFIRSFSEHVLPGRPTSDVEAARRFYMNASPLECFFISQHGFHYHHVHHVYANVPTFNVRAAHEWLIENVPEFSDTYIERPGYVGTAVRYLFERPIPGQGRLSSSE